MSTGNTKSKLIACILLGMITTPTQSIAAELVKYMDVRSLTSAPAGFIQFCRDNLEDCIGTSAAPPVVTLTKARWDELVGINQEVNGKIQPMTDQEQFGVADYWSYPTTGKGDCEDYQLLKRKLLMKRGWPVNALLMTVVRDENNEGHAVLTVRTDKGDLILDNQNPTILPWFRTPYRYVKRQSSVDASRWEQIEDRRTDTVATAR